MTASVCTQFFYQGRIDNIGRRKEVVPLDGTERRLG